MGVTCSVQVYQRLTVDFIVETFAAVLLQLDLFDTDCFPDDLAPFLPSQETVV